MWGYMRYLGLLGHMGYYMGSYWAQVLSGFFNVFEPSRGGSVITSSQFSMGLHEVPVLGLLGYMGYYMGIYWVSHLNRRGLVITSSQFYMGPLHPLAGPAGQTETCCHCHSLVDENR